MHRPGHGGSEPNGGLPPKWVSVKGGSNHHQRLRPKLSRWVILLIAGIVGAIALGSAMAMAS